MTKHIKFVASADPKFKDTVKEDALELISSIHKLAKHNIAKPQDVAFAKRVQDYIKAHNAVGGSELLGLRRVVLRYA
jgi:hypothetical protein